jgi:hypothetical protein
MKKTVLFLVLILAAQSVLTACDMSAFIIRKDLELADFNNLASDDVFTDYDMPKDYLAYVMSRSTSTLQNDGYGLVCYTKNSAQVTNENCWYKHVHNAAEAGHVFYTGNLFNSANEPDVFDVAYRKITRPAMKSSIVLCHARNATLNPFAPGNHPFRMDVKGQTYSLMHNGYISTAARTFMINETNILDNEWFDSHTPNFDDFANASYPASWIDSEVLFNYLMCHIVHNDYSVYFGLKTALKKLETYLRMSSNVVNFVFSDGKQLYAFRSTGLVGGMTSYKLSYKISSLGFSAVRTGVPTHDETEISQFELVALADNGSISHYTDILDDPLTNAGISEEDLTQLDHRTLIAPFNPNDMGIGISFYLDETAKVKLSIYNLKGQLVVCLYNSYLQKGTHSLRWNGKDSKGRISARGVYYLEMLKGSSKTVSKIIYNK